VPKSEITPLGFQWWPNQMGDSGNCRGYENLSMSVEPVSRNNQDQLVSEERH